jgi:mannose-1-phosphate guanylyltransferase|tara:strand:- start:3482 stop:4174 length:693 start_codon:yes stop_codon:yes gene_type:complete
VKAVLLIAGLGTRLRPLTDSIPKCLLPINGVPLLAIWFDKLLAAGVTEVLINTHWLAGQVSEFVADSTPKGLRVRVSYEPTLLGSAGTLAANRDFCSDGPFFIIYGDNLSDVDLADLYASHMQQRPVLTLGTFEAECPERCGIAEIDLEGVVRGFVEKPERPLSNHAAAGIYVAEPEIFDYFPEHSNSSVLDLGFDVIPKLVGQMRNYSIKQLIDIGTHENYQKANGVLC